MSSKETDLAALLIGVFAVGITTATSSGFWDGTDSIVCIPVLLVLFAYSLSGTPRKARERFIERLAVAVVLAFIFSVLLAFPIQEIWGFRPNSDRVPDQVADRIADQVFYWALIPGCVAAGILWYWTGPGREKRFWRREFWLVSKKVL